MENIQQELKFGAQTVDVEVVTVSGPPAVSVRETRQDLALRAPVFIVDDNPTLGAFIVNSRELYERMGLSGHFSRWWARRINQQGLVVGSDYVKDHNMLP